MKFIAHSGPFIHDKDSTQKIMNCVLLALTPIILFAFYKNGMMPYAQGKIGILEALRPLLMILVSIAGSFLVEFLYYLTQKKQNVLETVLKSYFIFPGLFLSLMVPLSTPLYVLFIGAVIASLFGKLIFGGFGHNIFNPALVGYVMIVACFGSVMFAGSGYMNALEVDTTSTATPLSRLQSMNFVGTIAQVTEGNLFDQYFGFMPGALGEVSKFLILIALAYLIMRKVIKWPIPVFSIGTVFLMTLIIGLMNDMNVWYPVFHILSGGFLFGMTFMATDPVTSPTTKSGQILYGIFIGIMVVIMRFAGPYAEGVATAILAGNLIVIIADRIGIRANLNKKVKTSSVVVMIALAIGISIYFGYYISHKPVTTVAGYTLISKIEQGEMTTYQAKVKGFKGDIVANIIFQKDLITSIDIIEQHETYYNKLAEKNYLAYLITQQSDMNAADTVSGATKSSTYIKVLVRETIKIHKG